MSYQRSNTLLLLIFLFLWLLSIILFIIYYTNPIILHLLFHTNYSNGELVLSQFKLINTIVFFITLFTVSISLFQFFRKGKQSSITKINSSKGNKWILGILIVIGIIIYSVVNNKSKTTNNLLCNSDITIEKVKACTLIILRDDGGHGTGFSTLKGYLVTNKHVIEGANKLTTWINGEKELKVWNYSPTLDIAVLKLPEEIPTCDWYNSSNLKRAEPLYAIGWPEYSTGESTITKGIFSRLNGFEGGFEFIQTDAAINPGNSGGPLVSDCGIVGINTLKDSWSKEQLPRPLEGLGNALSSRILIPLVKDLINNGNYSEIPRSEKVYVQSNPYVPNNSPVLDLSVINDYLSKLRIWKQSWKSAYSNLPKEKLDQLMDLFDRQIIFCETLIGRLKPGTIPSQDDLFMWDSVVKMSYESATLSQWLNNYH